MRVALQKTLLETLAALIKRGLEYMLLMHDARATKGQYRLRGEKEQRSEGS